MKTKERAEKNKSCCVSMLFFLSNYRPTYLSISIYQSISLAIMSSKKKKKIRNITIKVFLTSIQGHFGQSQTAPTATSHLLKKILSRKIIPLAHIHGMGKLRPQDHMRPVELLNPARSVTQKWFLDPLTEKPCSRQSDASQAPAQT